MDSEGPDSVERVLLRLGGYAGRQELLRHVSMYALRTAVARGDVERRGPGVYALPAVTAARAEARALRGLLSHGSAASHWLMDQLEPPGSVHVTVPPGAHRVRRRGVTLHRGNLPPEDETGVATSPLRTVLDCAGTLPFRDGLVIADSALHRGLVEAGELREAADRRRGPGARRCRRVALAADGRAESPLESVLRAAVLDARIRGFQPQFPVRAGAVTYRLDLGDPRRRVALEADGFAFHGTPAALERDCRRSDELVRRGWRVLRFAWGQVVHEPEWVVEVVRDTCLTATGARRARPAGQKRMVA